MLAVGHVAYKRKEWKAAMKASAQPAGLTTETTLAERQRPSFWSSSADRSNVTFTSAPRLGRTLTSYLTVLALVSVVVGAAPPPKRTRQWATAIAPRWPWRWRYASLT